MAIPKELLWDMLSTVVTELERVDPSNIIGARARGLLDARTLVPKADIDRHKRSAIAERDDEVARLYLNGLSLTAVGQQLGISPQMARTSLRRRNITPRPPGRCQKATSLRRDETRLERIIQLRSEGKTLQEIGAEFGITRERVRQICARANIDTSERPLTADELSWVDEYVSGASLIEVAEKHGLATSRMKNLILRSGNKLRPSRRNGGHQPATIQNAERAAQLYTEGRKVREIKDELGISYDAGVYRLLAIAGVSPRIRSKQMESVA